MKKIIAITISVVCLVSIIGAVAMGGEVNVFESLATFKLRSNSIDNRLDANLNNPEKYKEAMDESLDLFNSAEYEKIADEIIQEQENSREYLYSYLADVKCALQDFRNSLNVEDEEDARSLEIVEQQISIYEVLEAKAKLCSDSEISSFFSKCKQITSTMETGEKIPEIPDDL